MRSDQVGYAPYLGIFLRELEDKVEVARIQQQVYDYKYYVRNKKFIYNTIYKLIIFQILDTICNQHLSDRLSEDAFRALNSSLLDITKVEYKLFLVNYNLYTDLIKLMSDNN